MSLYETLTHLEVQCNKKEFSNNKSRNEYELKLFIKMELWQKEEVRTLLNTIYYTPALFFFHSFYFLNIIQS